MRFRILLTVFAAIPMLSGSTLAAQDEGRAQTRFMNMDTNGDGRITRSEWPGSTRSFQVHDCEGHQAGKEDGARNRWDLEGQRELEQADSGHQPGVGPREEYQSGYREAFRRAYREGFGR